MRRAVIKLCDKLTSIRQCYVIWLVWLSCTFQNRMAIFMFNRKDFKLYRVFTCNEDTKLGV